MGKKNKKKGQPGEQVSTEDALDYIEKHGGQSDYLHYDENGKVYSSDKKNNGVSGGCFPQKPNPGPRPV